MKVVLCGSKRDRREIYRARDGLIDLGVDVVAPDFEWINDIDPGLADRAEEDCMEHGSYRDAVEAYIFGHLDFIRQADVVWIINSSARGRIGLNTALEFGFALREIPVFLFRDMDNEPATVALRAGIAASPGELVAQMERLQERQGHHG